MEILEIWHVLSCQCPLPGKLASPRHHVRNFFDALTAQNGQERNCMRHDLNNLIFFELVTT